jgi:hypothetical protein
MAMLFPPPPQQDPTLPPPMPPVPPAQVQPVPEVPPQQLIAQAGQDLSQAQSEAIPYQGGYSGRTANK